MVGSVSLVGAGPWDPELLTLAARDRLERADVVISDYLVNPALLVHCRPEARIFQRIRRRLAEAHPEAGAALDQGEVNALMVEHARAGRHVVRLKGGDPIIFGRGAEEANYLRQHQIPFELVPGVSAAIAAPEMAGIPITHRDHTPSVSFVSGYEAYDKKGLGVAWEHLANSAGTLVLLMGVGNCRRNAAALVAAGRPGTTPAAVVRWGTRGIQQTVVGTLDTIADAIETAGIRAPAVMVVGEVVARREEMRFFEDRPLFGRRVVVTRAASEDDGLVRRLSAQGADVVAFPALAFAPPDDPAALRRALARVRDYDGVILTSPRGVAAFCDGLIELGLDARVLADRRAAVIGTGTAQALARRGLRADLIPDEARAEGLVDALRDAGLLARRWLHLRADEGRDLLARSVAEAGGQLDLVIGYRTVRPEVPFLLLQSLLPPEAGGEGVDAVCFASGKAARHFLEQLEAAHGASMARALLDRARVICIGPVTEAALRALDIEVHGVAEEASAEALAEATTRALLARG